MRIVLLVTDLEPGGTPLRLAALARGLHAIGRQVAVGCLAPPGPVAASLHRDGIEVFACGARQAWQLTALLRLRRTLRRLRPDVLHSTLVHANVAARLTGWGCCGAVLTGTATIEVERRWHRWIERATAGFDDGHIVHSRVLAGHVCRAFGRRPGQVHVVPPLIWHVPQRIDRGEARRRLGLPADGPVLLWAGRFDPVKRIERTIDCVAALGGGAHLLLAGDGPERPQVERLVTQRGLSQRVHLLGWLDDLSLPFSAADVLLLCSRTEGMPNVVLQAMAFGLPVVAGRLATLDELAGDPPALVQVDEPSGERLAVAVRRLLADPPHVAELTQRARQRATPWTDAEAVARQHVAIYQRVLAGRRR